MKNRRFSEVCTLLAVSSFSAFLSGGYTQGSLLMKTIVIFSLILSVIYFFVINVKPSFNNNPVKRLRAMYNGRELMIILAWASVFHIIIGILWKTCLNLSIGGLIVYSVVSLLLDAFVAVNGFLRIFTSSRQLGIVWRALIILLWWLPPLNIYLMAKACQKVYDEYDIETQKNELDNVRKESEICRTKYPILMVHGVFFRDLRFFNYWGRIPQSLIKNGAEVYYGEQQSAASVEDCAAELEVRIKQIISQTGCEKVNIIAHSKGGLDSRCVISSRGMAKYVASLTTVNTPHRGCAYADFLLKHIPMPAVSFIAAKYNSALHRLGDRNPDFIAAVSNLTMEYCTEFNKRNPNSETVYYQSIGSRMKSFASAGFPLCLSYHLVKLFGAKNSDGLVDSDSMRWGKRHTFFEPKTKRGISHGDMIDLMREDIKGFDVREEYVKIVSDLKKMGF
ncbi:MAG: triacylglycerol lipase [Lachnospiraceae bacterium]|nr:triacylglycerol lipase [Lachnospiraceae bacterium]